MKLKVSGMGMSGVSTKHLPMELIIDLDKDSYSVERHRNRDYLTVLISKNENPLEIWRERIEFLKETFEIVLFEEKEEK